MLQYFRTFTAMKRNEDEGASAVEYGLLVAAIAALIVIIVFVLGGFVQDAFEKTCEEIGKSDNNASTVEASCV